MKQQIMPKKALCCALLFLICLSFLLTALLFSNSFLQVQNYFLSENGSGKILFLSDLHGKEFGADNRRLVQKIAEQAPDIICLGGDFIDEENTESDNARFLSLAAKLIEIAPVYYSLGNHDANYFATNGYQLIDRLESLGCRYLENEYVDITVGGTALRLGGMYGYAFNQQYAAESVWQSSERYSFLTDFTSTDTKTVLLCHRPDSFLYGDAAELWDIDVVLCGHTHGGLWRLPFIGGLFAPEQGFFPKYDKGEFDMGSIKMIISAGLSGSEKIPRLFNPPEITVIHL